MVYPLALVTAGVFRPSVVAGYFSGRAERLISYKADVESWYLGIGFE